MICGGRHALILVFSEWTPLRDVHGLMSGRVFWIEADFGDAAIAFGVIHTVTDDEAIRNFEAGVVGFDGNKAALGFVEAGGYFERGRLVLQHEATQIAERQASIKDVFHDDDVPAFDGIVDIFNELDGAGGDARAAIAGYGYKVEGVVDFDGSGEICEKDGGTFEDADKDDGLSSIFVGYLLSECSDPLGNLLCREENFHLVRGHEGGH